MADGIRVALLAGVATALMPAGPAGGEVIDFEDLSPGTPVGEISGVRFSEDVAGHDLAVVSRFDTTSGDRGLGIADGGLEVFLPGDVLTLDFEAPVESLEIRFVSSPNTPAGAFTVTTAAGGASSGATPDLVLADQGEVFIVALQPPDPFGRAVITAGEGLYSYNLDDIRFVPEPASAIGPMAGALELLLLSCARRRRRTSERRKS